MYVNQLIITLVIFGLLLYLTTNQRGVEKFNMVPYYSRYTNNMPTNNGLQYHNYHPYYEPPNKGLKPFDRFRDFNNFKMLQDRYRQFNNYNITVQDIENFNPGHMMNPVVKDSNNNAIKITFFMMLIGLLYYLYNKDN